MGRWPGEFRLATGSQASQCMCRKNPNSACLDKLSVGGNMLAQRKTFDFFFTFRLVTGSQASECVCRRIRISGWLHKLSVGGTMPAQWKTCGFLIY